MEGMPLPPQLEAETSPIRKKSTALIAVVCFVMAAATLGGWLLKQRNAGKATAHIEAPRHPDVLPVDTGAPSTVVATPTTPPVATPAIAAKTTAPIPARIPVKPPEPDTPPVVVVSTVPVPDVTDLIDTTPPVIANVVPPETTEIASLPAINRILLPVPDTGLHPNLSQLVPRYHALVIGINEYANHGAAGWDNLRTTVNDARVVARTLNEQYGFAVTMLLHAAATRSGIMQELDTIATAYPDEAILIYYAGHGFYKEDVDQGYWIPSDARRKTDDGRPAKQDWVWNSTIQEMLNSTKSKHVLMIADSCFSGALFRHSSAHRLQT